MATEIDAGAEVFNFKVDRGERLVMRATIKTKTDDPQTIDIIAHTVELIVQVKPGGTQIYKQTNGVGDHEDPSNGTTQFTLGHTTTMKASSTRPTTWHYAIHWKSDTDPEDIHSKGVIVVSPTPVGTIE